MSNIQQVLQSATHSQHQQLDRHPLYRQLLSSSLCLESYRQILMNFYQWHWAMNQRLSLLCHQKVPFLDEPILQRLSQDLAKLDCDVSELSCLNLSEAPTESVSYQLGALYVLQGSSLGGQVIAPKVERTLQRTDVTQHFWGPKSETYTLWSQSMAYLDSQLIDEISLQQAIQGAQESFALMMDITELQQEVA
jgi:heme oxygenase